MQNIKTLQYMMTSNCNAHCKMCNLWVKQVTGELEFLEFKKFYDNSHNFTKVDLTGGEIFLIENIQEYFKYFAKQQKLEKLSVTTNGSLTDRIVDAANTSQDSFAKYKFFISFDGLKDIHNNLRGAGEFEDAISTLEALLPLQSEKFKLGISTTINDYNAHIFPEMQAFFGVYGLELKSINVPNVSQFYKNKKTKYTSLSSENVPQNIDFRDDTIEYLKTGDTKYQCSSPQNKLVLSSKGDIRGCTIQWDDSFVVGNIREHNYDLTTLLRDNADRYKEICRRASIKDCKKCFSKCETSVWDSMK